MVEKKIRLSRKILDIWMTFCIRRKKKCFSHQTEYEISRLNPGVDSRKLVYEHYRNKISLCLVILAAGLGLILVYVLSSQKNLLLYEERYLEREPIGGEEKTVELDAQIGEKTVKGIAIPVRERNLNPEETEQLLEEAAARLPAVILGENAALTYVTKPLYLPSHWEDSPVTIFWNSSDLDYLQNDGTFGRERIPEMGKELVLTATLSYEELSMEKAITVTLYPSEMSPEDQLQQELTLLIEEEQEKSLTEKYLSLPVQLEDAQIIWREPKGELLPLLFLLLAGTLAAVFIGKDQDLHKQYEERNRQLLLEYAEFVSKLQLWVCSGMSIRSAFFKMAKEYQRNLQKGGRKNHVSEELLLAVRKMENGMSEAEALEFFARRCHLFCYKKLISLIQQNLKRGTEGLRDALTNETKRAFEERKQTARRLGEEAGTKLLIPMMLMMGIVLVIIMVPAYFSFGGIGS